MGTFVSRGKERVGFVLEDKVYGLPETQQAVAALRIGGPQPDFLGGETFPDTMEELLTLGQRGIDGARRVEDFVRTFVSQKRDPFELRHCRIFLGQSPLAAADSPATVFVRLDGQLRQGLARKW